MKNELFSRIISSLVILPVSLFFLYKGSFFFIFFLLICFLISLYEWFRICKKKVFFIFGFIFLIISFLSTYFLRSSGDYFLFIFIISISTCISTDIGGYLFGKILKGPKLTKISPKKTFSGMFGGYLLSFFSFYVIKSNLNFTVDNTSSLDLIISKDLVFFYVMIFLISTVSQIGDIIISYFKRLANKKNTGNFIPGHGGILDRIDGMIFAFPFTYIIFYIIT